MLDILPHEEDLAPRPLAALDAAGAKLGDFSSIFDVLNGLDRPSNDGSDSTLTDSELDDTSTAVESADSAAASGIRTTKGSFPRLIVGGLFGGLDLSEVVTAGLAGASLGGSDSDDEEEEEDEKDDELSASSAAHEPARPRRSKVKRASQPEKKSRKQPGRKPHTPLFQPASLARGFPTTPTMKQNPFIVYTTDNTKLFQYASLYNPLTDFSPVLSPVAKTAYMPPADVAGCDTIMPLYWATRQEKLDILQARLASEYHTDQAIRKKGKPTSNKPIHVFVDLSNIVIGFYTRMCTLRGMPQGKRLSPPPPFFFHALAQIIERGRPAARKVTAGSVHDSSKRSEWPRFMNEAEALGYEMNILSRVSRQSGTGTAPSSPRKRHAQMVESGSDESAREDGASKTKRMGEQAVDEILQLKMCHSVLDHKAGTIVLATGDAAEAEFSDGFLRHVERAIMHGWRIELVAWASGISRAWRELDRRKKTQFRIIELDTYAEELLGLFAE